MFPERIHRALLLDAYSAKSTSRSRVGGTLLTSHAITNCPTRTIPNPCRPYAWGRDGYKCRCFRSSLCSTLQDTGIFDILVVSCFEALSLGMH
jgi:hypothetical protein